MEGFGVQSVIVVVALVFSLLLPSIAAQVPAAPPAPPPSSDGVAIDQGIAYVLMLLALALTYMIH